MKTLSKRIVIFVVSGVVIAGTLAAFAHNRSHGIEHRAEWVVAKVSDELKLDDAQIDKLNVLKDELIATRNKMHDEHETTHSEALAMFNESQLDRQKALTIIESKTRLVNQYAPNVVNAFGDFYDSLNEAQRQELREHINKLADRHDHHRGHHH